MLAIEDDQWGDPTPCTEWDVRDVVNHMVSEERWAPPLLVGKTIEEVGDQFEGDLLGNDPKRAWTEASTEAIRTVEEVDDDKIVHLSFGDVPAREYLCQLLSDHVIHCWDLARGIGGDERLEPDLVDFTYRYLKPRADHWRTGGVFGARAEVPRGADRQTKLLAITGRQA